MTTTPTLDIAATVAQTLALAEAGCDIVRITAQNVAAAQALRQIRREVAAAGYPDLPLVADIHFLPQAAMEAVEHVEKVRVNPGNYADKKKFAQREYTDADYAEELERLHEAFAPLVRRARELGRSLRIGTNHGSLSDRIMNRYGDTPMGMCESALEFLRIARAEGFHDLVLSMKASNPKVMIEAYRLVVARMAAEGMAYPLHLGVTEAGDGDDARIKSAIGMGSLLWDGLGDTLRVSLTEDPVAEVPVARDLARKAERLWAGNAGLAVQLDPQTFGGSVGEVLAGGRAADSVRPFEYSRRSAPLTQLGSNLAAGPGEVPRVILRSPGRIGDPGAVAREIARLHARFREAKVEGLLLDPLAATELRHLERLQAAIGQVLGMMIAPLAGEWSESDLARLAACGPAPVWILVGGEDGPLLERVAACGLQVVVDATPQQVRALAPQLAVLPTPAVYCLTRAAAPGIHALGSYRLLAEALRECGLSGLLWLRATAEFAVDPQPAFGDRLLDASVQLGGLLCDGLGDMVSVESEPDPARALTLAYNILQGARTRSTKTEYVACPSCGRTLFDLQSTTQRIRDRTGHLKGVTIAVMGCIVNGPGEMADADFGYVGGAPGKVNLYVGKTPVEFNIPTAEAVDKLVDLIRHHGKWIEPEAEASH